MASADTPPRAVCVICKLRKKKCDKVQPRCGYCTQKNLECSYQSVDTKHLIAHTRPFLATPNPIIRSSLLLSTSLSDVLSTEPTTVDSIIYLQVLRIIKATGQFVDDISARYFRGVHVFIPVISRPRFHDQLVNFGGPPPTTFSLLLLCMCLITYHPGFASQTPESLDIATLYITTKTLFAQIQASSPPNLHVIQAGAIIAAYEYASKKIPDAFATIGLCVRMGYASSLHLAAPTPEMDTNSYQQAEEEGNTWWGIVACERTIFCEIAPSNQPLASRVPARESRLPTEPMLIIPNPTLNTISPGESTSSASGFGCIAQATWLLDELFNTIEMTDADDRLNRLDGLDHTLRTVLAVIMDQSGGAWGTFCTANGMLIRGLFILHWEIINQVSRMTTCKRKSPDEWMKSSYLALDSFTKMVLDIAVAPNELPFAEIDTLPPSCAFVIQAAVLHIDNLAGGKWDRVRAELEMAREKLDHRWAKDNK